MKMKRWSRLRWAVIISGALALILLLIILPEQLLRDISVGEVFAMILPATAFPILYWLFFPWYRTPLGRALMTKALGLALLIDTSVAYFVFGDNYFLREHVRFLTYSLILIGLSYQCAVIIKIKRESIHDGRETKIADAERVEEMEETDDQSPRH